jgi:DNA-directed RNA polymerase specialized sigma24 family protein
MNLSHEDADELVQEVFVKFWKFQSWLTATGRLNLKLYQSACELCLNFLQGHNEIDLQGLTVEQQIIFVLKQYEEFDYPKIADITHFPVEEVRAIFKAAIINKKIVNKIN